MERSNAQSEIWDSIASIYHRRSIDFIHDIAVYHICRSKRVLLIDEHLFSNTKTYFCNNLRSHHLKSWISSLGKFDALIHISLPFYGIPNSSIIPIDCETHTLRMRVNVLWIICSSLVLVHVKNIACPGSR